MESVSTSQFKLGNDKSGQSILLVTVPHLYYRLRKQTVAAIST
jgi:hypothetical protein